MDDVKESVRQGVTKVAGRLSGMASGVMSSIQVRLGVKHQNIVITYSAYFRESNMPTSPWVFIGICLVSTLVFVYVRGIGTMYENNHRFFGLHRSYTTNE